ncbi:tail tape measure protein [Sphingopyxis sp. UBA6723]|jgi:phage-related minor tail protein|uniref:tail tape measure protein n=1 Tax=Sphingopyxis sp. UBA6723 TaxID=1947538 RepID=UPI0025F623F8|nr:tail tape measure protein [Sphingopyxis sp. UBA6723]
MDEIDEMVVAVRADTGAFRRDIAALRGELEGALGSGADAAGRRIEDALSRAIVSGKLGFEDLKRLALSVMAEIARAAIANGIGAALGGGGQGGGAGGLLSLGTSIAMALFGAPGRATGGPVSAGRAYRVGERGPELFVPTSSGRVEAAGAGVRNIAITVNVRGEVGSEPQRLAQTGRQLARAVRRAVAAGED